MLIKYTGYFILLSLLTAGCTHKGNEIQSALPDSTILSEGLTFIENEEQTLVTAPCDGKIVSIKTDVGQDVNAGKTIALIENSDILILQKEYLESKNELDFCSREYARQGDLTVENATSMKRMEIARHDYQQAELRYLSLRKQLTILGINPENVNPDNLQAWLSIASPVKGNITSSLIGRGYFVKKGDPLFEIAGSQTILLQLEIPEISIWNIQKDQLIRFYTVSDTAIIMNAQIISTPKAVDPVKHTAVVVAKPSVEYDRLLPGMSVRAIIYISDSKQ